MVGRVPAIAAATAASAPTRLLRRAFRRRLRAAPLGRVLPRRARLPRSDLRAERDRRIRVSPRLARAGGARPVSHGGALLRPGAPVRAIAPRAVNIEDGCARDVWHYKFFRGTNWWRF